MVKKQEHQGAAGRLVDWQQLLERFCGEREEAAEVAVAVQGEIDMLAGRLRQAAEAADRDSLALKSSLWSICATSPWETASQLYAELPELPAQEFVPRVAALYDLLAALGRELADPDSVLK